MAVPELFSGGFIGCCQACEVYSFEWPPGMYPEQPATSTHKERVRALKDRTSFGNVSVAILRKEQYDWWKDALAECGWVQLSNWVPGAAGSNFPIAIFGHCTRIPMKVWTDVA